MFLSMNGKQNKQNKIKKEMSVDKLRPFKYDISYSDQLPCCYPHGDCKPQRFLSWRVVYL